MISELGHFCLILAAVVALLQSTVPLIGALVGWGQWQRFAPVAAILQALFLSLAFIALMRGFIVSDFSLRIVTINSHTLKPMLYKVAGVWGNHEGSMLLWVLTLGLFGMAVAIRDGGLTLRFRAIVLSVQGAIGFAFLCFTLFTSNPFDRIPNPPLDGQGLNPLLQDPGLAFHPPFLYLGYVGLSVAFAFAIAALIDGKVDAAWARWVRPWTLAAWMFLTVGIALGSWWAYYELGWGGFWFWDPVENASFMPWLLATALLHSAIVVEKREALKAWTVLLAILAFAFSLIGTFIVRSGLLTSVHAFANDPERGLIILAILVVFVGAALILFSLRAGLLEAKGVFAPVSRESALVLNNILLAVATLVVFIGTIWPSVSELAFDRPLSVGPPFFNTAFTPFILALAVILPVGAILPWKRGRLGRVMQQLAVPLAFAAVIAKIVWVLQENRSILAPVGLFLALWIMFGVARELHLRSNGKFARLKNLPRADWGKALGHAGIGIIIFAIAGLTAWEEKDIRVAKIGESFAFAGYEVTLESVDSVEGPNYLSEMAQVKLVDSGGGIIMLYPEKRIYPVAGMPTTEAAISNGFLSDIYVVIGDPQPGNGYTLRSHVKPFANWIWGGAILMALGGLISLSDRRLRIGHAARSAKAVAA